MGRRSHRREAGDLIAVRSELTCTELPPTRVQTSSLGAMVGGWLAKLEMIAGKAATTARGFLHYWFPRLVAALTSSDGRLRPPDYHRWMHSRSSRTPSIEMYGMLEKDHVCIFAWPSSESGTPSRTQYTIPTNNNGRIEESLQCCFIHSSCTTNAWHTDQL